MYSESELLKSDDIRYVIGLLEEEYQELGFSVYVYKNYESALRGLSGLIGGFDPSERVEFEFDLKHSMGLCDMGNGKIIVIEDTLLNMCSLAMCSRMDNESVRVLCDENLPVGELRLHMVYTLIHELRHAWQSMYRGKVFDDDAKLIASRNDEVYMSLVSERDADRFASRMMNRHKDDLVRRFNGGIDYDWVYGWYHTMNS